MSENNQTAWFFIGIGIGAGLGALFAPRSGRRLRRAIRHMTEDGLDYAAKVGRDMQALAEDTLEDSRDFVDRQRSRISSTTRT